MQSLCAENMRYFVVLAVCAFLVVNVHGTQQNVSSQDRCTVDSVCGILENVLKTQDRLEKNVKEVHRVILGERRCNEGMKVFNHFFFSSFKLVQSVTLFFFFIRTFFIRTLRLKVTQILRTY